VCMKERQSREERHTKTDRQTQRCRKREKGERDIDQERMDSTGHHPWAAELCVFLPMGPSWLEYPQDIHQKPVCSVGRTSPPTHAQWWQESFLQ
jgi:hypothetical protein